MFQRIRHSIGLFFLRQKPVKRKKKLYNLRKAKSVGILFEITTESHWKIIYQIYSELIKQQKNVSMLGIYYHKNLPNWLPKTIFPLLTQRDFNFWLLPKSRSIAAFCSAKFDILIDFSLHLNIQNLYIISRSKAHLKVGKHDENSLQYYDFFIKKPENTSFEEYVKNLLYYLTTINTDDHEG